MRSFCKKTYVHKIPRLGGGCGWGILGADFIFMGAGIFLKKEHSREHSLEHPLPKQLPEKSCL